MDRENMKQLFEELYGKGEEPRLFFAPGRVNLIGEHIDYNGGLVFPAALTLGNYVMIRKNGTDMLNLAADDLPGVTAHAKLSELDSKRGKDWGAYQFGVVDELMKAGKKVCGADMLFSSTLPFGAGLSSSASIEVVTGYAMLELNGESMDMTELSLLTQRAENKFVGVNCGIMDQFACANGEVDCGMLLDCASVKSESVPLNLEGYSIVIGDTKKKRGLADSKYNERRAECETALEILKKSEPKLNNLCELSAERFYAIADTITDETVRRRAEHVVCENDRVKSAARALADKNIEEFGKLLNSSHYSLRDLYEVTGKELDAMTDISRKHPGCMGSRMTGAGFGGCTISIVKSEFVEEFIENVRKEYREVTGLPGEIYVSTAGKGPHEIN
ncbi:MAG: galactokinase [Clostridia bacterium]|nr:galactokinase [Clostridia bacterium]